MGIGRCREKRWDGEGIEIMVVSFLRVMYVFFEGGCGVLLGVLYLSGENGESVLMLECMGERGY